MYFGVAARTERDHQVEDGLAWHTVVNDDLPLPSPGCVTDATTVAVTFKHCFAQATEVFGILSLQRVAG